MRIQTRAIAESLVAHAAEAKNADIREAAGLIIQNLASKGQLHRVRDIIRSLDGAWRRKFGIGSIRIESSTPLSESALKTVESVSKGASVEQQVRSELLGGARVRIDDRLIDATIAGRFEQLRRTFQKE